VKSFGGRDIDIGNNEAVDGSYLRICCVIGRTSPMAESTPPT